MGGTPEFEGLILLEHADLSGDPIGLREFDAPESRRRGEKFDAYALALVGIVAQIHNATFLLVLRERIGKYENGSQFQILVEVEQSSMSVDNDRFADMAKVAALLTLACKQHPNTHEDSRTASLAFIDGGGHGTFMVNQGLAYGQSCARFAFLRGKLAGRTGPRHAFALHRKSRAPRIGRRFRRADGAE